MAKEDFNQVSSSFETVQCILSSILCPSIFREIWRQSNGSPLLCPINAISLSSYVFRLQYPKVLHCRIVPIQKLKTLVALESNLKVTRKFAKIPHELRDRGVNIFTKRFIRHHRNLYILYFNDL
jgi:hypothetical protein